MPEPVFFSRFEGRIDRAAGVIKRVRIITPGPAIGHDLEVDSTTITNLMELVRSMPDGIKTKLDHKSGIGATNGRIVNVRPEDGALYGDWELLKSHTDFELIMDLAETQPSNIGFSISADGAHLKQKGKKTRLARFTKIYSSDLVGEPAANPGLFERPPVDTRKSGMTDEQFAELKAQLDKQGKTQTELCERFGKMETFFEAIKKEVETDPEAAEDKTEMSEIKTAMTELAVQFTALQEVVKGKGQQAAAHGNERTELAAKTPEETALQARMAKAKTDLEAAHGLTKYSLAGKFEREFGKDWKTKLTQLEARR